MFWDASAIIPLCIDEPQTKVLREAAKKTETMAVWWGSLIECCSAFARLRRDGRLKPKEEDEVRHILSVLSSSWIEIEPCEEVRTMAGNLLLLHPLHAADSLQLAAALVWAKKSPKGHQFVCLDRKLGEAARKVGFKVMPAAA